VIRYSFMLIDPLPAAQAELRRLFELLRSCGYDGIELDLAGAPGDLGLLEHELSRAGLVVPSFLTGAAYGEGLCLSAPDPQVRRRTVGRLIQYLDVASRFRALLVVGLLQGLRSDEPDPAQAGCRIVEGLRQVSAAAVARGVELAIEPVNHLQVGFNHSVAEVCRLIDAIGSPACGPMVDTLHMNIEERSLVEPVRACGAALRHVHLCESNGSLFGTGHLNFAAVLQALEGIGYSRFASVKVYRGSGLEEAARTSIAHLRLAAGATAK